MILHRAIINTIVRNRESEPDSSLLATLSTQPLRPPVLIPSPDGPVAHDFRRSRLSTTGAAFLPLCAEGVHAQPWAVLTRGSSRGGIDQLVPPTGHRSALPGPGRAVMMKKH